MIVKCQMRGRLTGFGRRAVVTMALALGLQLSYLPVAVADELAGHSSNQSTDNEPEELGGLDITELANIRISLASRRSEMVANTPAAVTVLTGDEILRSGANSVPEALRWAPGVNVARFNSSAWAVSIRGGNDVYANKLLVMQDGRSLYDPAFAGVHWESLSPMIEDLDRIEVVRGPGGTLWGANAVNGVINIVSKSARETQGGLVYGGGGVGDDQATGGGRYGLALSEESWMRVYAKYDLYDDSRLPDGSAGHDTMDHLQTGFRYDREVNQNTLTLQGDFYTGELKRPTGLVTPSGVLFTDKPLRTDGGNVLGRWTHEFSADSKLTVQSYYDHVWRDAIIVEEDINTFDVDAQHEFKLGRRQAVTWGVGYRLNDTDITGTPVARYEPPHFDIHVFSLFAQDEITLIEDRLKLTLGCKLEHNNLTGFEVQPSGSLLWTPTERQTFWASVSRAVRTPSLLERDIQINTYYTQPPNSPLPLLVRLVGNRNIESETLIAYEAGWRMRVSKNVLLDVAGFFNDYDKMTAIENEPIRVETAPPPPHLLLTTAYRNAARVHSYGGEVTLTWQPTKDIRFAPFYSCLHMDVVSHSPTVRPASVRVASSPANQFGLRSSFDILRDLTLDVNLRWVDTVPTFAVPSYWEADVRAAWEIRKNLELSVAGLNLLHNSHPEFGGQGPEASLPPTEVPRAVNCKLTWRF
jgi:iron complex outermembrane receptor protein